KVSPALKCPEWTGLNQRDFTIKDEPASTNAIAVDKRPYVEEPLAAHDLASNDPIKRTAIEQFLSTLWGHAGRMNVLALFAPFLLRFPPLLDPILEIFHGIGANAEFDKVQRHAASSP